MYHSNISQVVRLRLAQMQALQNPDAMLRTVALSVLPELKRRVHVEGKDSTGSPIGTYSAEYMKLRTGNYQNADRKTRGVNKGQLKNSGTYSKGNNAGAARPKYNRTAETKVVLSLTRQMENDLSVIAVGQGYGIGYNNPDNFKKSQYNEETYKKEIWKLTAEEKQLAIKVAIEFVNQNLSGDQNQ